MARNDIIWGIDVGQCAMKALRCRADDRDDVIIADAFDYIEYPKILTQPGAEPDELIGEALKQFLSRNSLRDTRVAISVPGQTGLARFIKLPPVEAKKIPDIVRYEARQQIPFDLNDVVWDYQRMGGGAEEEGFILETEIGLFAMKRDAVFRTLEPFLRAGIEVDFIQLVPLALYNYVLFDQLHDLPPPDEYDPENPPQSIVILSLGTDATDLVVTNGYRVWQRSIPIGGNHFTKALTKELKLTFAKAEHLKRNATAAQDPKAVFQAMRPVFSDLLNELQRSLGYFTSIDRAAKIGRVVALGNVMKLPGLRRYLSQGLGYEVDRIDEYRGLTGSQVLSAPAFSDNALSFAVCYGLALQGLESGGLQTNLLPREIVRDRLIRQKKPWAVAAAAVLLLAFTISYASFANGLGRVRAERWRDAERTADTTTSDANRLIDEKEASIQQFQGIKGIGDNLVGNVEGRILWLELLRAVNECLPRDAGEEPPENISRRKQLHISNLECQHLADVSQWFSGVKRWYQPQETAGQAAPAETEEADAAMPGNAGMPVAGQEGQPAAEGPSGKGWIIRLCGHHYHNLSTDPVNYGAEFVRNTLIKNLHTISVALPNSTRDGVESVSVGQLGIGYPVLIDPKGVTEEKVINRNLMPEGASGKKAGAANPKAKHAGAGKADDRKSVEPITLQRFDFVVHFCWQPKTPTVREEVREQQREEKGD